MAAMDLQTLAYLDHGFLESADARPLRILSEYLEPLKRFREHHIHDTVAFFGSSRIKSHAEANAGLARLLAHPAPGDAVYDEKRRLAEKAVAWSRYYEECRTLAAQLTSWARTLDAQHDRFVVCSGGGPGIMEAANRGAVEAGGKSIGLNIKLPFEQGANRYITDGLGFEFHYFFMRKFWFAYLAKSIVVFPGGFGTLDEMFEFLTLMQTQKLDRRIQLILYGSDYWDAILKLDPMEEWGALSAADQALVQRADTPEHALALLTAHLTANHLVPDCPVDMPALAKTR
jgi:uncharacterized protein (TIGR00730 family)